MWIWIGRVDHDCRHGHRPDPECRRGAGDVPARIPAESARRETDEDLRRQRFGYGASGRVQQGTAFSRAVTALFVGTARLKAVPSRPIQIVVLLFAVFVFLGAGDENARFSALGHKLMCVCSCNQVLLECNHVGCSYSDRMRGRARRRPGSR